MDDKVNSSNGSICSVFDSYDYVIVAAVSAGSAMVSALCCVFVICLIFLFKKHYFFIQRIILYHCLAALFRSIAVTLRLHRLGYQNNSTALKTLCTINGFLDQVTLYFLVFDYSVITFILLMTAVFHKNVSYLEGLFVVLIFVVPFTFNWIPFINNSYGRSGAWCWIRTINYEDCTENIFGDILEDVIWQGPYYSFVVVIVTTYVTVIILVIRQLCCRKVRVVMDTTTDSESMKTTLSKEVLPLLFFPFGAIVLNLIPIANGIYNSIYGNPSHGLYLASAIFSPLQGGYLAVVYTLDRDTLKRLRYSNLVATLCKRKSNAVQEFSIRMCTMAETASVRSDVHYTTISRVSSQWPSPIRIYNNHL